MKNLLDMNLYELRQAFPHIKATTADLFREKLNEQTKPATPPPLPPPLSIPPLPPVPELAQQGGIGHVSLVSKDDVEEKFLVVDKQTDLRVKKALDVEVDPEITDEVEISKLAQQIKDEVPEELLEALYEYTGCSCPVEALVYFYELRKISVEISKAMIVAHRVLFKQRLSKTGCAACIRRRLIKLQNHFAKTINLD